MELPSQVSGLITELVNFAGANFGFLTVVALLSAFASIGIVSNKSNSALSAVTTLLQRFLLAIVLMPFVYIAATFTWGLIIAGQWQTVGIIIIVLIVAMLVIKGNKKE